jgi:thiol-disulfide isomerase/thioredoxin
MPEEELSNEILVRISQLAERIEDIDIITRQQTVLDRLGTIRYGKKKLINQLQILIKDEANVQLTNELIQRLLRSFNELRKQEQEFTYAMREVVIKFCGDLDEILPKLDDVQQHLKNDGEDKFAEFNLLEVKRLTLKLGNVKQMIFGFNEMFKEAEDASSLLDQQLKARLGIFFEMKKQKDLVKQLHEKAVSFSKERTAHQQFTTTSCNSNSERKQRQLERLRREAVKRGLVNNDQIEDSTISLTTKGQDLANTEEVCELHKLEIDDERIPQLPQLPNQELSVSSLDKKKDDLQSNISERFTSLAARKQKMRLIQSKINNLQHQKMESTYDEAVSRYRFLSGMRTKLESLQTTACATDDSSNSFNNDNGLNNPGDDNKSEEQKVQLSESNDVQLDGGQRTGECEHACFSKELDDVNSEFEKAFSKDIVDTDILTKTNVLLENAFAKLGNSLEGIERTISQNQNNLKSDENNKNMEQQENILK